jgi:hypothetical protein
MLEAVRGWLTPPVLFVLVNLVIGTIAVMSKVMSATAPGNGGDRRSLMRTPSAAFDRFRCFSFSRLGLPDAPFDDGGGAAEAASPVHPAPDGGGWRRTSLLRSPSVALDRVRGFSFSRRAPAPATPPAEAREEAKEQTHIERSQSEAAGAPARRRPRARKARVTGREERASDGGQEAAGRRELPPAVEVDERADDFIRQFREQLRLQRLDSILRYKDALRRAGTV